MVAELGAAFEAYVVACFALVALFYYLAFHTGTVRQGVRAVVNPEDVRVYLGANVVDVEHADVQRVKRAHQNLIENAVPFFIVGLLYALTRPNPVVAGVLYGTFVLSRVAHALVYIGRRQPVRSGAWMIGVLDVGVMAALLGWGLVVR
jgi:glutathione S-transferase